MVGHDPPSLFVNLLQVILSVASSLSHGSTAVNQGIERPFSPSIHKPTLDTFA
jgi:hypothetical protein